MDPGWAMPAVEAEGGQSSRSFRPVAERAEDKEVAMKSTMGIAACALVLVLSAVSTATLGAPQPKVPPIVALMVPFDSQVDLETGQTCSGPGLPRPGLPPCSSTAIPDMTFEFNATRPMPTVLFQQSGARIALLIGVPFAAVDAVAVTNGLVFTEDLQDVPFGPNDTAILHTVEGNDFKVGLALCFWPSTDGFQGCAPVAYPTGTYGVRFQYQQLR
jgi:hypothetical protein